MTVCSCSCAHVLIIVWVAQIKICYARKRGSLQCMWICIDCALLTGVLMQLRNLVRAAVLVPVEGAWQTAVQAGWLFPQHLQAPASSLQATARPQEFAALPLDALAEDTAVEQARVLYAQLEADAERMPALRAMLHA